MKMKDKIIRASFVTIYMMGVVNLSAIFLFSKYYSFEFYLTKTILTIMIMIPAIYILFRKKEG